MQDRGQQIGVGLPLLGGIAEHGPDLRAHEDVRLPQVERADERDERQLLDQRAVALLGLRQPPLAVLQRLLGELALGDVLHLRDEVERPVALLGPDERDAQVHPDRMAERVHVALLALEAADLARERLGAERDPGLEILGVGELLLRPLQEVVGLVPDELAKRPVDVEQPTVGSHERHADRRVVEGTAEPPRVVVLARPPGGITRARRPLR